MARVTIKMPTALMDQLAKAAEKTDTAIPKALKAGGKVVFEKMQANLHAAIGRGTKYKSRSTGKLLAALGVSPVKVNDMGIYDVKVGLAEGRGDANNAMLANLLEYGKSGQPPKPFLKRTKSASQTPCIEAMQTVLKEELKLP